MRGAVITCGCDHAAAFPDLRRNIFRQPEQAFVIQDVTDGQR